MVLTDSEDVESSLVRELDLVDQIPKPIRRAHG
jgi:hypothetical protein